MTYVYLAALAGWVSLVTAFIFPQARRLNLIFFMKKMAQHHDFYCLYFRVSCDRVSPSQAAPKCLFTKKEFMECDA